MQSEIEVVAVPEQYVVCLRARGPVGELVARLARLQAALAAVGRSPTGPPLARFYDDEYDPADTDYDVCLPIGPDTDGAVPDEVGGLPTAYIPAHHALSVTQAGPHRLLATAHEALRRELDSVGYTLSGPVTEVFLRGPGGETPPADYLTEVRYPYAR